METVVFFLFITIATIEPKKKTTTHYHHLLRYNKTKIEEADGSVANKVAIAFFVTTKVKKEGDNSFAVVTFFVATK